MPRRRAKTSNMSRARLQKIAPALLVAQTQRLFQQPAKSTSTRTHTYTYDVGNGAALHLPPPPRVASTIVAGLADDPGLLDSRPIWPRQRPHRRLRRARLAGMASDGLPEAQDGLLGRAETD